MSWLEEEQEQQNIDDYQSYKITQALKGKMTPSLEGVIRLIRKKGYDHEKIQNQTRKSAAYRSDDNAGVGSDHIAGTRQPLY